MSFPKSAVHGMKEVANNPNMPPLVLSVNNFSQGKGVETTEQSKGKKRKNSKPEEREGMPQL